MKCPRCNGRKYIELDKVGLVVTDCSECGGTGVIDDSDGETINIGLSFQLLGKRTDEYTDDALWEMAKEAGIEKTTFPYQVEMPCGNTKVFKEASEILSLPPVNIMCSCGNPNHYIVKFEDLREVVDDSGTERVDNAAGSGDSSQSQKPQKPRAKKKARRRAG